VTAISAVASFALVAGLMTIIPGLDTVLVVRTALAQGRRRGFAVTGSEVSAVARTIAAR
jgi:threonine/homoserine/homoserine lactone efflux protein